MKSIEDTVNLDKLKKQTKITTFDIGGTWFRSAKFDPISNTIKDAIKIPALNYVSNPDCSSEELQDGLLDFLVNNVEDESAEGLRLVGAISLGAPINAYTGQVYGSGPLWGPNTKPFNIIEKLKERAPYVEWHVMNDVTALLKQYVFENAKDSYRKVLLITISTGIGARLFDNDLKCIPLDSIHGIQGEIGHLPVWTSIRKKQLSRRCACGGINHLNAFSAGRAIEEMLGEDVSILHEAGLKDKWLTSLTKETSREKRLDGFVEALKSGNTCAIELLDAITKPLANLLNVFLTIDPGIDRIVLTGGVVRNLNNFYINSLIASLDVDGLYIISNQEQDYISKKIIPYFETDDAGLIGAALQTISPLKYTPRHQ